MRLLEWLLYTDVGSEQVPPFAELDAGANFRMRELELWQELN